MHKNHFLLLEILKNTECAQLCPGRAGRPTHYVPGSIPGVCGKVFCASVTFHTFHFKALFHY